MVAYEDMTVEQLQDTLKARDLPVSGNKGELVARLEEADQAPAQVPPGSTTVEASTAPGPEDQEGVTTPKDQIADYAALAAEAAPPAEAPPPVLKRYEGLPPDTTFSVPYLRRYPDGTTEHSEVEVSSDSFGVATTDDPGEQNTLESLGYFGTEEE